MRSWESVSGEEDGKAESYEEPPPDPSDDDATWLVKTRNAGVLVELGDVGLRAVWRCYQ